MSATRFHPGKFALYTLLSVADLSLTFFLLTRGKGIIYESNPVASAWLASFGWSGLVVYKALTMALLASIIVFISVHQNRLAGRLLVFACVALAAVVGYSANIAFDLRSDPLQLRVSEDREKYSAFYFRDFAPASRQVRSGTWTVAQAADKLVTTENEYWQSLLRRRYPGLSDRDCLAAYMKECVGVSHKACTPATPINRRIYPGWQNSASANHLAALKAASPIR
jgi:hypothetical protein